MFQWARNLFGMGAGAKSATNNITARYDNALTTPENERNWWAVDYLSAKSANNFQVRRQLRMRSRYEVSNNPYLFGITNNNADDLISTGPTLKMKTGDTTFDREVEISFSEWAAEVDFTGLLRTCKLAKTVDGEGFLILKSDSTLGHAVKLFPIDVEADQITTPAPKNLEQLWVDGMTLNPVTGRPVKYSVLRHHPGDYFFPSLNPFEVDEIDARYVIHWFQKFRPGQVRGIPAFTPSLDLATELRAFRKAVLVGAQTAAEFAAVVENELGTANTDAEASYKPYQRVRIDRGQMVYLPPGTKMHQFDPKQPTTSYEMFQEKCLAEACRPLAYPLNLALGSSQKFNFSSAKLDHINYRESLSVERRECERVVLDKIFRAWFEEATLAGAVRKSDWRSPPHEWHWPGFASLDPKLDADTDHARLAGGTLTLRDFWASRGRDWREMLEHLADEKRQLERLGLTFGDVVTRSITDTVEDPSEAANAA